jgi:hypothetical protein
LDETYRAYTIRVTRTARWDAILVEPVTGAVLPTKATASLHEGRGVALTRARALIDLYAGVADDRQIRAA